jgi:hypothetical protein
MENSEAFSWEHYEKANRAKTEMNCTFFVQMKAASSPARRRRVGNEEKMQARRRQMELVRKPWVNSILGKNWRHYSPSTGSVFIVGVC